MSLARYVKIRQLNLNSCYYYFYAKFYKAHKFKQAGVRGAIYKYIIYIHRVR